MGRNSAPAAVGTVTSATKRGTLNTFGVWRSRSRPVRWSFKWAEIEESCRDEPGCEWTCPQATSCFCKCRDLDEDEVAAAAEAVAAVTAKPASFRFLNW